MNESTRCVAALAITLYQLSSIQLPRPELDTNEELTTTIYRPFV